MGDETGNEVSVPAGDLLENGPKLPGLERRGVYDTNKHPVFHLGIRR
jgi:hypothetical protein